MKYIITGGAGFIGSHIAEELSRNHEIIIIDNLFSGKESNIASFPVQFKQGTITDLPFLMEVFKGADGVFHQAAITSVPRSVKSPLPTHEVNCTVTQCPPCSQRLWCEKSSVCLILLDLW